MFGFQNYMFAVVSINLANLFLFLILKHILYIQNIKGKP